VKPYVVVHPCRAPPFALRLECDGFVIAYSGDTEWTESLVQAARGADLFIAEAYTFERRVRDHLDLRTLANHLDEIGAKRIIVTHMSEDVLSRPNELDWEPADDGIEVVLD
jgi:ribonuclease BN (tRNA processing enzyme)